MNSRRWKNRVEEGIKKLRERRPRIALRAKEDGRKERGRYSYTHRAKEGTYGRKPSEGEPMYNRIMSDRSESYERKRKERNTKKMKIGEGKGRKL